MKPVAGRANSDFMVDVLKSLDIDYVYSNPASSFRGLHESLINYGQNKSPSSSLHARESSVAMAHGYFKVTGKPQMMLCHAASAAARRHGGLQCLVRRAAVLLMGAPISTPPSVRRACRPRTPRKISTRWCATSPSGRPAGVAAALRAVAGARLQVHDDAAA